MINGKFVDPALSHSLLPIYNERYFAHQFTYTYFPFLATEPKNGKLSRSTVIL